MIVTTSLLEVHWVAGEAASKLARKETSTLKADTVTEVLSTDELNLNIMIKLKYQHNNYIVIIVLILESNLFWSTRKVTDFGLVVKA